MMLLLCQKEKSKPRPAIPLIFTMTTAKKIFLGRAPRKKVGTTKGENPSFFLLVNGGCRAGRVENLYGTLIGTKITQNQ